MRQSAAGAEGISDLEGKAATGSGERAGKRVSFKSVDVFSAPSAFSAVKKRTVSTRAPKLTPEASALPLRRSFLPANLHRNPLQKATKEKKAGVSFTDRTP
jgi:hypothetical protein